MPKSKHYLSPEDIFAQALRDNKKVFKPAELRLLTSGLTALRAHREKTLTITELQSIKALLAYVAFSQEISEDNITALLLADYNAKTVEKLPSYRYQEIVEYLVDFEVDTVVH